MTTIQENAVSVKGTKSTKATKRVKKVDYFENLPKLSSIITSKVISLLNEYFESCIQKDEYREKVISACIAMIATKVKYAEKQKLHVPSYIKDNYPAWIDNKVRDLTEIREAEKRTIAAIRSFLTDNKDYYVGYSARINEAGNIVTIQRGNALPIKACDSKDFLQRLINTEFYKRLADNNTKEADKQRSFYIAILHVPVKDGKAGSANETYFKLGLDKKGKVTFNLIGDVYNGKRVNVLKGVRNIHNALRP